MLEEIAQQPEALARTIAEERAKVARLGERLRASDLDLIVLVARGSSDNAALFGRYLLATQTYTGQLLHFYMLAEALAGGGARLGYEAIPDLAARALELRPQIEQLVERYVFMENCVVVGRGLVYANAFETALKLMETCYVVAERFSSADFLHGPLAVVERHFPIFAFAPPGVTLAGVRELLARLKELRADTLVFTSDAEAASLSTRALVLPTEINETLAVIPYIIPAQLFAALLADAKGLDPDAPRSLAKVTRTL